MCFYINATLQYLNCYNEAYNIYGDFKFCFRRINCNYTERLHQMSRKRKVPRILFNSIFKKSSNCCNV